VPSKLASVLALTTIRARHELRRQRETGQTRPAPGHGLDRSAPSREGSLDPLAETFVQSIKFLSRGLKNQITAHCVAEVSRTAGQNLNRHV
jgi:hypothetical protein